MTPIEALESVLYFNETENWGDINKVHPELILKLDAWRKDINVPILISPLVGAVFAEDTEYSSESWHYIISGRNDYCMAANVFPLGELSVAWAMATKHFNGIGFYPEWIYDHPEYSTIVGGMQVDIRPDSRTYWGYRKGEYYDITGENYLEQLEFMLHVR